MVGDVGLSRADDWYSLEAWKGNGEDHSEIRTDPEPTLVSTQTCHVTSLLAPVRVSNSSEYAWGNADILQVLEGL